MDGKPKSSPELLLEAEQAHDATRLTAYICGELLERVKEVSQNIEERVHHVLGEPPGRDGTPKRRPGSAE